MPPYIHQGGIYWDHCWLFRTIHIRFDFRNLTVVHSHGWLPMILNRENNNDPLKTTFRTTFSYTFFPGFDTEFLLLTWILCKGSWEGSSQSHVVRILLFYSFQNAKRGISSQISWIWFQGYLRYGIYILFM